MDAAMQRPVVDSDHGRLELSASVEERLRFALRFAVLAPSNHNTQPWRFIVGPDSVAVCADRLRALPVADPFDRELTISCGAALFNLRVALARVGLAYSIALFPSNADPDVLAEVRIVPDGRCDDTLPDLFDAIATRVTTRQPFADEPVDQAIQQALIAAGTAEGVDIACVSPLVERERIAMLVALADRQQFGDPRFRRELANWIHPRRREDGMPAYATDMMPLLDFATPLAASVVRTFDLGGGVAATHHRLVVGSPLIVCLATGSDDREAWLATGQALERVLLAAASAGLTASYLNQPIEVPGLREQLPALVGLQPSANAQLLLRVGRGPDVPRGVPHSPRRALDEVVS
ncbi:Acg family FMN-binding oxidoreductase [Paraburkholderia caballeronis]|uniref:Acg family FMN-binding oxidoreductase n=1 Tax=Paraburkholderia caballeronis TaxID=416943 RepID=UPI0010650261|nr:nitroreductase family protein [Paraburkholderia caballeronis]TDV14559.1 nitroreductase family protein [Paraburkholderia caballeronis]TDV23630.1 nitroreductase family protein [Paraburkholderia caballeronis]